MITVLIIPYKELVVNSYLTYYSVNSKKEARHLDLECLAPSLSKNLRSAAVSVSTDQIISQHLVPHCPPTTTLEKRWE